MSNYQNSYKKEKEKTYNSWSLIVREKRLCYGIFLMFNDVQ